MEHRVADRLFRAPNGFLAWRLNRACGVAELMELRAKLYQSTLKRVDSTAEPRLRQPAVLEGEVVALDGGLGSGDLGLQSPLLGRAVGSLLGRA